ncbi:MAG: GGDEF domain-containing protein, partial [Pseudomonadota bacterium]
LFGRLDAVHKQLNRLSYTDVLTGLANRRYFMDRLQAEVVRQRRTHRPLSLIMIDVDHFKKVNDTHGHPAGDEVLATLGMLMRECVRNPTDLPVRLGGEEFAIVLPDASLQEAHVVCERLHQWLARHEFVAEGHRFGVTVSMGLAQGHGQSVEALMQQADRNLYRAKQDGRNRSISSDGAEMAA